MHISKITDSVKNLNLLKTNVVKMPSILPLHTNNPSYYKTSNELFDK